MPRQLKCPHCGTLNAIEEGDTPTCSNCGFASGPPPGSSGASFRRVPREPEVVKPPRMPVSLMASIGLFGAALLVMLMLQLSLMHWSTADLTVGGSSAFSQQFNLWNVVGDGTNPTGGPTSYGYWDASANDLHGIWLMRMGGPLLLVGTILAGVAGAASSLRKRRLTNWCGWAAMAACALMVVTFALGIHAQQDQVEAATATQHPPGGPEQVDLAFDWAPGFYLGIAAAALVAVATTLGPVKAKEEPAPTQETQPPVA